MTDQEQPEVFAVNHDEEGVKFSRREFLGASGVVAAGVVAAVAMGSTMTTNAAMLTNTPTRATNCTVRARQSGVEVHVGPGFNRGIRAYLPMNEDIPVLGKAQDSEGDFWWQVELEGIEQAWVHPDDVTTRGNCNDVRDVNAPPIRTAVPRATVVPTSTVNPGQAGSVQPGQTGINYTRNGQTYTLPCGSPLPANSVCVCNCVTVPAPCSCDSYSPCGCDSNYSSHYWYPN